MLRIALSLMLLLLPLAAAAATSVGPGDVSGTWNAIGSPYLVQGHLRVPTGETLLIQPGVDVRFTGNYVLLVEGALLAAGISGSEIHFRPDAEGITWGHVEIAPGADDSSGFFYCIFEGGNALANPAPYSRHGGAVFVGAGAIASLTECVIDGGIAEHGGGVYSEGEVSLMNCVIRNCQAPGGALQGNGGGLHLIGTAVVSECEVVDNVAEFIGGGIFTYTFDGTVTNCRILRNRAGVHGAGIGCQALQAGGSLYGNLIAGNEACSGGACQGGGLYLWYAYGSLIEANTIVDNFAGGGAGIAYGYATVTFERCLIAFNQGLATADFNATSTASFAQTCVWGNTGGDQLQGSESETLTADPLFCDASAGDYTLCADSPCLPLFIGVYGQGCGACATAAESASWSRVKSLY
jgi:hypothetical protein